MNTTINAMKADPERIKDLIEEFDDEFSPSLSATIDDIEAYANKIASSGICLTAELEGETAGFSFIYANRPPAAYISLIATKKRFSGKRIGSSIMNGIKELADDEGFSEIRLAVNKTNQNAIEFYQFHGFTFTGEASETQFFLSWKKGT